ncbi:putative ribonuclease H-like domain-containing protein [Tanacetum coccineum]|uniref:Ribonuclease H-like domain-containing protein n=1 Tax=Tanacetum coccineum TaxID=301880 RepID=A0ABQ5AWL0_9ASTR
MGGGLSREDLKDYAIIDSGCSGSMTGDKDKLSDFKEFKGGYVAFGNDSKGGRISGKGTIKTSCLDFEKVSYVEELKFNLLSVSQICDKKHNVLFTDKECLILSPKFKFVDEDLVILRAPRKNDVYSLDLKKFFPLGNHLFVCKGNRGMKQSYGTEDWDMSTSKISTTKGKQHQASCKKIEERTAEKPLDCSTWPHLDLALKRKRGEYQFAKGKEHDDSTFKLSTAKTSPQRRRSSDYNNLDPTMMFPTTPTLRNIRFILKVKLLAKVRWGSTDESFKTVLQITSSIADLSNTSKIERTHKDRKQACSMFLITRGTQRSLSSLSRLKLVEAKMQKKNCYNSSYKRMNGYYYQEQSTLVAQGYDKKKFWGVDYDEPPGFEDPAHPNKVYRVVKTLYGLHQAPRAWYERLSTFLLKHGYRRGAIDKTLFIKKDRRDIMLVQVYVDDIIFGSTKSSMVKDFEDLMQKEFKMSSMGELTFFLGLQVKQSNGGIFLSQDKYVKDILNKFDFRTIKPASTPIEAHKSLGKDEEGEDVDVHLYRSMIGCLMYLTASRPDIMFAVCLCARFQVTPKVSHLHAVKRIFRYLKHQPKLGLWYPKESPFHLEAFSDSDYAGDNHDRRSTSGGCQYLGRRLVSWQCKKQTIVAISSTEAEYVAAASCCAQVLWMQNQLLDYGFNFMNTEIHIDNESTICIVKNPVLHSKTKHIQIRHHFIRDCYEQRLINVVKVHTDDNVADLLTKGFDLARFNFLVVTIGMMNP